MDISTLETVSEDEGTVIHLKDAAGELLFDGQEPERTPVTALVAGTYSQRYRKAQKKVRERNIRAARRNEDLDGDALEDRELELEAACIIAWTLTANGQPFPITMDNWKAVVAKQPQWREQVQQAMTDHARFFAKKSAG
jgi:hypothetical protein